VSMQTKLPLWKRCVDTVAALLTYMRFITGALIFCAAYTVGLAYWKSKRHRQDERKTPGEPQNKSSGGTNGEADPWRW
jgi:hypothetical protein